LASAGDEAAGGEPVGGAAGSTGARGGAGAGISPADLARLASLELRARVIVEGAFSGMHHNLHPGTSMEFTEHKEYAPGDEIRRIDWKAVGRVDRYYVKRFEDETEMRTYLVVDASGSMSYRRRGVSKMVYAGYLAGAVAYLLGKQGDPVGLLLFDEKTRHYLPPSTRPGQIREVFRLLDGATPEGPTDPARALGHLGELLDKRSLILFFSDLLDAEREGELPPAGRRGEAAPARGVVAERLRQLRARGHDVVLFHLLDPDELELPFDDLMFFEGVEPGDGRTLLAQAADLRQAFARESRAFRERWRLACLESRVEYRFARSDQSPADVLREFLSSRRRTRARR
jgi:uncharacterized protein (DUF58 family)